MNGIDGEAKGEPENEEQDEPDLEEPQHNSLQTDERDILKLEIDVREDHLTIESLVRKIDKGQLISGLDFPKRDVWTQEQKSKFIESILLNYPLPPLYLSQDISGRLLVIDGRQRCQSIQEYLRDVYALAGLERLTWLNGKKFSELEPPLLQSRIEDRALNCYVLRPGVPLKVVYDIFARINRRGTPLEPQEIRNVVFQGPGSNLLGRLAAKPVFRDWIGDKLRSDRKQDQEAVLRCIAFARADIDKVYKGDMDKFLESALSRLNLVSEADLVAIENRFLKIFEAAREILGEDAFRLRKASSRGRLNIAIMESVYRFFHRHSHEWLLKNSRQIADSYQKLLSDPSFLDSVKLSASDMSSVKKRFHLAQEILEKDCAD